MGEKEVVACQGLGGLLTIWSVCNTLKRDRGRASHPLDRTRLDLEMAVGLEVNEQVQGTRIREQRERGARQGRRRVERNAPRPGDENGRTGPF